MSYLTVAVPVETHASYQLTKALPWWFRRYIMFDKRAKLEPLYKFEGIAGAEQDEKGSKKPFEKGRESWAEGERGSTVEMSAGGKREDSIEV
jgi:hypothetical protein